MRNKWKILTLMLILLAAGCKKEIHYDPATISLIVSHRNLGLAFLEENKLQEAITEFQALVKLAPDEPLGYANLGLAYLRMNKLDEAEKWLQNALKLAPDHPGIRLLLAKVYEFANREEAAISVLEKTLRKHPDHVRTLYQLAQYYQKSRDKAQQQKAVEYLSRVVNALPANVAARLQLVELLLQNNKTGEALQHTEIIEQLLPALPADTRQILKKSLEVMRAENAKQGYGYALMFHNMIRSTSFFQAALTRLKGPGSIIGEPVQRFVNAALYATGKKNEIPETVKFTDVTAESGLKLTSPGSSSSPRDNRPITVLALGDYDSDGDPDLFVSQWQPDKKMSRQFLFAHTDTGFTNVAGIAGISHRGRDLSAAFGDYDNDGYLDLLVTNTRSNHLYHNNGDGTFRDVTKIAGIAEAARGRKIVFADLDLEGDLDIFIATESRNRFYRNNADGTFTEIAEETGVGSKTALSRDAVFGDFDDDGDIDLFVVNQDSSSQYFDNLRQGYFRDITGQVGLKMAGGAAAVAQGDYNNDGFLDLIVARWKNGVPVLFLNHGDGTFEQDTRSDSAFHQLSGLVGNDVAFFDADNDGYLDVLFAGEVRAAGKKSRGLWLFYNNGSGKFRDAGNLLPEIPDAMFQVETADYDNDGDLDIFLAGKQGIHLLRNDGGNVNNYLVVRLAGLRSGSSKNNFYGIGAKVEVKAGDLYQMRIMDQPVALFGIGNRERADVVRIIWSNGVPQNHFKPEKNQTIVENQILKGSCPWLFAWDGKEFRFVTDALWASALGMPLGIMAGETFYAFPNSAREYFKIPGEKLKPRAGKYALQFTTELWETPYLDRVKLLVVDHPDSEDIYVDETFTPPPFPPFRIYTVAEKHLPLSAQDGNGTDLLAKISHPDGEYIANLSRGTYQGITELHDLILNLGDCSRADSVYLFLYGWLFPTDASINVNTAQSRVVKPVFPYLQVIDENGQWKTVIPNLGFPKGKYKTMVVNLTNVFPTTDYRVRIRTNMQIYWDYIFYATRLSHHTVHTTWLEPARADLHYRGFSKIYHQTPDGPEIPDYRHISTGQKWRDLTGYCTRYGDVLPLLLSSDSKYVVMNAGDELTLEFDAASLPVLPEGWRRDFIFYNDGWLKDGDLNTARGQTVEPLPFHGMSTYPYPPTEHYPNDKDHRAYLQTYNTRKITTEKFKRFLFNYQAEKE